MSRLLDWLRLGGTAFSQLLHVLGRGPFFVAGRDDAPDPDETLSAFLGRRAAAGRSWALAAALVVDVLMWGLDGFRWGHCARAAAAHAASRSEGELR
jgi:hypothetical protein